MGDDPVLYQIRVYGHLGPTLLMAFPAFAPEQQGTETVLTGLLPDTAALYGVLAEVEALGLDLLEVRKIRPPHDLPVRPIVRPDQPPSKGERSVSTEQQDTLDAILRQSALPVGSDVAEQRRLLHELTSRQPLAPEVTMTSTTLGGVPVAAITVDGVEPRHVVLYFHGGVYVLGDAESAAGLASQVGRRTGAKVYSVDYRLAPEHPYPAAVDDALATYEALLKDGTAPSDIVLAGESAGGGLVVATLVGARDRGLPLPAAAYVMSPYTDLTLAGASIETKRDADPLLSRELLEPRVTDYTAGQDPALGLISPIFADLSGLPPLLIQVGSHEVLLDDAVRLAQRAGAADVEVTLEITPRVPHVFQAYLPLLDEAAVALDRAGAFLSARLARR